MKFEYESQPLLDSFLKPEQKRFQSFREAGHFYFDKLWNEYGLERNWCYEWLSQRLNIPEEKSHFSVMTSDLMQEAIYFCRQLLNDLRRLDLDFGDKPKTPFYINEYPIKTIAFLD